MPRSSSRSDIIGRLKQRPRAWKRTYFKNPFSATAGRLPFDTAVEIQTIAYAPGVGFDDSAAARELR